MIEKLKTADVIKFIIIYSIVVQFLTSVVNLPTAFFYLNDLLLIVIVASCVIHIYYKRIIMIPKPLLVAFGVLLLLAMISFAINQYSPLQMVWGARNNFRVIMFFFACCMCLRKKDIYDIFGLFFKLLPLNAILCTLQYFMAINSGDQRVLQFIGDHVGGMFGNSTGCNRILNVYIMIVFMVALAYLLKQQITKGKFLQVLLLCVYMSVLAELKIVILEMAVVTVVMVLLIMKRMSKWLYLVIAALLIYTVFNIWAIFNPTIRSLLGSLENLISYTSASSYGQNSLNRMTVIPYMHDLLFEGDPLRVLFGIGLGNADSSGFSFLVSDIHRSYGELKYSYFMHGMLYVELGAVGLVAYILFFVVHYFTALRRTVYRGIDNALVYSGIVFNLIAVITIFYNTTLRSEVSCFLVFFFLAIPIIWMNRKEEDESSYSIIGQKKVKWKVWR